MTVDQVKVLEAKASKATVAAREAGLVLMRDCPHPAEKIVEVPYGPCDWLPATAPFRVCLECGYAEQGWYCGYFKLSTRHDPPASTRGAAWPYVRLFLNNEKVADFKCHGISPFPIGDDTP